MKYMLPTLLLLAVCCSLDGVAEERPYWLVGSFKSLDNANQERSRIARTTSREVKIVLFDREDGERFHRLVVHVDRSLGLPGFDVDKLWVIKLDIANTAAAPVPPRTTRDTYLVAASFGARDTAQAMLDDLHIMGETKGTVRAVECQNDSCLLTDNSRKVNGTDFYRVLIGPLSDSAGIAAARRMLEDDGITGAWSYRDCVICADFPAAVRAVPQADPAPALTPGASNRPAPQAMVAEKTTIRDVSSSRQPVRKAVAQTDPAAVLKRPAADNRPARQAMVARITTTTDVSLSKQPARIAGPRKKQLTYLEFCTTEANSVERRLYCSNDAFAEKSSAGQLKIPFEAGATQMSYFEFCAKAASAMERQQYCTHPEFNKRVALMSAS